MTGKYGSAITTGLKKAANGAKYAIWQKTCQEVEGYTNGENLKKRGKSLASIRTTVNEVMCNV